MDGPIIVPRDHERVVDLPLPASVQAYLAQTSRHCVLTIGYVDADGSESLAATHEFSSQGASTQATVLRKRLSAAPAELCSLRFTLDGASGTIVADLPAMSPDLTAFANGALLWADLDDRYAPGSCAKLPITIRNDSAFAWVGGPAGVSLRVDLAGEIRHIPLPSSVPPGTERTFDISVQIPSSIGEHNLQCALLLAPSLPFVRGRRFTPARGRILVEADTVERQLLDLPQCRITIEPPDAPCLPGTAITLLAQVHNSGEIRIEAADPGGIRLRARWRRIPRTDPPIRDDVTVLLPYPLEPGDTCRLALDATVPARSGDYQIDVIAELIGVGARLGSDHCESPHVAVSVADPDLLDKVVERGMRRARLAADEAAMRAGYQDWARRCDTFDGTADCLAAIGLNEWPSLPAIGVLLPSELCENLVDEARCWLASQPYPAWQLLPHASETEAPDGYGPSCPPDLVMSWDPRIGRPADHALAFFAGAFVHNPALSFIYADYDHIDGEGRYGRMFLPAPDTFFARAQPQTFLIAAVRPAALAAADTWLDDPLLGAKLLSRSPPHAGAHLPQVLFHRFGEVPHYEGKGLLADGPWRLSKMHDAPGYAAHADVPAPPPRVTLIIPTRDRFDLLAACIGSILNRTAYPRFDLIVIDNGSTEQATLDYLHWLSTQGIARVIRDDGPFNWSRLNNRAAAMTDADALCFLNNDVEVTSERWLAELVGLVSQPDVGVAGPTLWFPDGTMQHVGVVFSSRGSPLHPFRAAPRGTAPFYLRSLRAQPAVTGACLTVRRAVFEAVGGFSECFPLGFNDVDFCMRVQETLGLPSVCTPAAELLHKESASRGRLRSEADHARFLHDLALFEARHLETARADRWAATIAHEARRGAPLTMIARRAPGARTAARRFRRMNAPKISFLHIPKTAGTAVRRVLERALPDGAVLTIGARAVVEGHASDPLTVARLAPLLHDAEVLISHVSHGFGAAVGWPCRYATILRAPRDRVRSHHGFLVAPPNAPLRDTPLANWSIAQLLRKGIIPGNLMLAKILGRPAEPVGWPEIDGRFPRYAGFGLPAALWQGDMKALEALPDIAPQRNEALVADALAVIERDFMFVGIQERLQDHLVRFGRLIDVPDIGRIPHINAARAADVSVSDEDLEAIDAYNALDRLLYEAILARPGGLFIADA
ncbi:Glycosyltransferase, GT2 family [Sphingomonas sp. OV641]|uniref:glycosyltransferase family 2 protein n=1 Tax=Sphingomonas sp. OV641 TaxID=1881068 RepID=UPI0008C7A38E|nr:glycosyltransferase family 2 protein [Sphingomonas sp. OV641]SEJ82934.1 Glycosyltransferase, GT2 family [Sphingomonas sp. OV641]